MATIAGRVEARFTVPAGEGIAVTYNGVGPTAVGLTAGAYFITDFVAHILARIIAVTGVATWTVALDTTTGLVSFNYTGVAGTYTITFSTPGTALILGFTSNPTGITHGVASTGAKQALGLWIPNTTVVSDIDSDQATQETDRRDTETPTGDVITLVGNRRYVHTGITWDYVQFNRIWISRETTPNQSYERFFIDAIDGNGNGWFTPGSAVRIYDHRGSALGAAHSVSAWKTSWLPGSSSSLRMSDRRPSTRRT
jgi:hypothetical protein